MQKESEGKIDANSEQNLQTGKKFVLQDGNPELGNLYFESHNLNILCGHL